MLACAGSENGAEIVPIGHPEEIKSPQRRERNVPPCVQTRCKEKSVCVLLAARLLKKRVDDAAPDDV